MLWAFFDNGTLEPIKNTEVLYMITLDNFEDFVPYKIWMRGEEYYETDAVSELEEISPVNGLRL